VIIFPEAFEAPAVKREAEEEWAKEMDNDRRQEPDGALLTLPALGEGRHPTLAGGLIAGLACDPHAFRSTARFHHVSRRRGGCVAAAGQRRSSRRSARLHVDASNAKLSPKKYGDQMTPDVKRRRCQVPATYARYNGSECAVTGNVEWEARST